MHGSIKKLAGAALAAAFLFCGAAGAAPAGKGLPLEPGSVDVYFSPNGGIRDALTDLIGKAQTRIRVMAFHFTEKKLANALAAAKKRGVDVEVILDKEHWTKKSSKARLMKEAGIRVLLDSSHRTAHNKVIIIDGEILVTGSYNFTRSAEEQNSENLLVIRSRELAVLFEENWELHGRHSERMEKDG